ncbi:hypothetical protein HDU67_002990, partial [Dinochytrium kinnereticum]
MEATPRRISTKPLSPIERDPLFPELDRILGTEEKEKEEVKMMRKGEVKLVMAATHMSFHVLLEEVSTSVLTVHNCGCTAVRFEWRRTGIENRLNSVYDGVQRFYFTHKSGVILPGSAFDFKIIFKSARPGIFTETWTLHTSPEQTNSPAPTLTLQGIAIEPETYKTKREEVERLLEHRKAESIAKEIIASIFASIKPRSLPEPKRRKLLAAQDDRIFLERNAELHVNYYPTIFAKFLQLSEDVFTEVSRPEEIWDRSIMSLYQAIDTISTMEKRSFYFQKLNDLVALSRDNGESTSYPLLYIICYDIFVDLADRIADTSESMRKKLALPLNRSAAQFFREGEDSKGDDDD